MVLALLLWAFRRSIPRPWLLSASAVVAAGYGVAEADKYQGDLLILPIVRTIAAIPERVGNWFTDPGRWPVFWEALLAVIVGIVLWIRLRPRNGPGPPLAESGSA